MNKLLMICLTSAVAITLTACNKYGGNYYLLDSKTMTVETHLKNETPNNKISTVDAFMWSMVKHCGGEYKVKTAIGKAENNNQNEAVFDDCDNGITYVVKNLDNFGR